MKIRPGTVPYKFQTAVYPSRMAPIGTKLGQNAFQMIPDVSCFDSEKNRIFAFVSQTLNCIYPPRMAPIGLKLGQNAFQMIPDILFFDVKNRKKFAVFGLDHVCPGQDTYVSWPEHMCPGQNTCVLARTHV